MILSKCIVIFLILHSKKIIKILQEKSLMKAKFIQLQKSNSCEVYPKKKETRM
ncbi:unnamed protein product [Paramecium sonneborni]|uniref:Uncharacterized protein n=1 Tax=Paramecium sonneborni TaxID=65129 RepID=A0A8S1KZN6_9CILI|nr:unnamed protein product [Paramecium sonneborni]